MQQQIYYTSLLERKWQSKHLKDKAESLFRIVDLLVRKLEMLLSKQKSYLASQLHTASLLTDWAQLEKLMQEKGQMQFHPSQIPRRTVPAVQKMQHLLAKPNFSFQDAEQILRLSGDLFKQAKEEKWEELPKGKTFIHCKIRKTAATIKHLSYMLELASYCQLSQLHDYVLSLKSKDAEFAHELISLLSSKRAIFLLEAFSGTEKEILQKQE
ncbi:MAG: hypothetical protein QXN37_03540 [Candidatus Anstonellaceae archaeon]